LELSITMKSIETLLTIPRISGLHGKTVWKSQHYLSYTAWI